MSKQINNLNNSLEEQLHLNEKQDKIDNNLKTKNKTIVGAINEVNNKVGSFSSQAENIINDINDML